MTRAYVRVMGQPCLQGGSTLIRVNRRQLDTGAIAVVRAAPDGLTIDLDARHITPTGAAGLEQALNGLAPHVQDPEEDGLDAD